MPLVLATLNLGLNPEVLNLSYGPMMNFIIVLALFPFLPFLLIIIEHQTMMKLENCHKSHVQEITNAYLKIRKQSANFIRTELGIESPLQITFSILLLLFSTSDTSTSDGLQRLFDETSDENAPEMPFGLPPILLLILTNIWTFFSAYQSFCKRMAWTKINFSIKAKCVLFLYVTISMLLTISVNIIFVVPSLGLLSILRHYQGENFPFFVPLDPKDYFQYDNISVNVTTDLCYFSDVPPFPWSDLTRFDYTDLSNPRPPPITIYTYFNLETILVGFWIIWFLHIFVVWFVKRFSNPDSYKHQRRLEALINAMENGQIPAPMLDWDDIPATIPAYVEKQRFVDYEMGLTIMANLFKHMVMMVPIWVFGKGCTVQIFVYL